MTIFEDIKPCILLIDLAFEGLFLVVKIFSHFPVLGRNFIKIIWCTAQIVFAVSKNKKAVDHFVAKDILAVLSAGGGGIALLE